MFNPQGSGSAAAVANPDTKVAQSNDGKSLSPTAVSANEALLLEIQAGLKQAHIPNETFNKWLGQLEAMVIAPADKPLLVANLTLRVIVWQYALMDTNALDISGSHILGTDTTDDESDTADERQSRRAFHSDRTNYRMLLNELFTQYSPREIENALIKTEWLNLCLDRNSWSISFDRHPDIAIFRAELLQIIVSKRESNPLLYARFQLHAQFPITLIGKLLEPNAFVTSASTATATTAAMNATSQNDQKDSTDHKTSSIATQSPAIDLAAETAALATASFEYLQYCLHHEFLNPKQLYPHIKAVYLHSRKTSERSAVSSLLMTPVYFKLVKADKLEFNPVPHVNTERQILNLEQAHVESAAERRLRVAYGSRQNPDYKSDVKVVATAQAQDDRKPHSTAVATMTATAAAAAKTPTAQPLAAASNAAAKLAALPPVASATPNPAVLNAPPAQQPLDKQATKNSITVVIGQTVFGAAMKKDDLAPASQGGGAAVSASSSNFDLKS